MHLMSPSFTFSPSPLEDSLFLYLRIIRSGFLTLTSQKRGLDVDASVDHNLSYSSLTSANFLTYARAVIDAILRCIKELSKRSPSALKPGDASVAHLTPWNTCVDCLVSFFDLARSQHKSSDPPSKPDRHFGRKIIAVISALFVFRSQHTTEVLNFIRNLQQLTRLLQRACVHAKKNQDARLIQQIPGTRKCLEFFVCAVKLLFTRNSCSSALWIGTLKNRDLVGQVVQESHPSVLQPSKSGIRGSELVEPVVPEEEGEDGDEDDDEDDEDTDDGTASVAPSVVATGFIDEEADVDVEIECNEENASDSECDILRDEEDDEEEEEEEGNEEDEESD
ncbi:unnamed protein product [Schistocephalus solidus]|uniref:FANCI_S4 domain-containing protein n=1 Tax=Schistocephalus solidus TaxID=70667 RepID=A0A183SUV7_SCHSO|nr:unnamed protein product [Schistocephalus solidus]